MGYELTGNYKHCVFKSGDNTVLSILVPKEDLQVPWMQQDTSNLRSLILICIVPKERTL